MKEFRLQKYRDIGDILTDTFSYIRNHYRSLGKGLLYFVMPFYFASAFLVGNASATYFDVVSSTPLDEFSFSFFGIEFWAGILMTMLGSCAIFTVTLNHIRQTKGTEEIDYSQLMNGFPLLFINLLLLFLFTGLAIFTGLIFFLIPGIYIGVKLAVAPAALAFENRNPLDAMSRSWKLTRSNWWLSFGIYIILYIITTMMSYVLVIPSSLVISLISSAGAASGGMWGTLNSIFNGLMVMVSSLFTIVLIIGMALHYYNLIERKEGTGLKSQIEELGQ